jgi:CBS domain containing-hemolysin-like protein
VTTLLTVGTTVLLALTAWLASAETVVERLPLVRALRLEEDGVPGGARLLWLLEHRTTSRNAILVATILVRSVFVASCFLLADRVLPAPAAGWIGVGIGVVASVVVGEVAPRTWTLRHLESVGLALAGSTQVLVSALAVPTRLLVDLGRVVVGTRRDVPGPYPTDEQVRELLVEEDEDEVLDDDERAMITSILELGDTVAREIMVPRPDMVTVAEDDELRSVIETVIDHGRSRIPVVRAGGEEIVGVVHAKDVLARLATRPGSGRWKDLVRPATFVPETKHVDALLRELRDDAVHQAIVVDEYGAVTGLVTIEDVLEEIVGEIVDEHDDEEDRVVQLPGGSWQVDARLAVDDLDDLLGTELPDEDWDTVGGLVFGLLGHVPTPGEVVELDGLRFTAERIQGRRVERVRVDRVRTESPAEEGAT